MRDFIPEPRRKLKSGEIEIMKGLGRYSKWFYVSTEEDAKLLIRLGRSWAFPTGITKNNSQIRFDNLYYIDETLDVKEETTTAAIAIPETPIGKKKKPIARLKKMFEAVDGLVPKNERTFGSSRAKALYNKLAELLNTDKIWMDDYDYAKSKQAVLSDMLVEDFEMDSRAARMFVQEWMHEAFGK